MRRSLLAALVLTLLLMPTSAQAEGPATAPLKLLERTRKPVEGAGNVLDVQEKSVDWAPSETALIICDMWDHHWCKSASERTAQIAPRIDKLAKTLRAQGALIIHAPSDTMKFYEGTPQRQRALAAPQVAPPSPPNCRGGPALPIDDTDSGCDDNPKCVQPNGKTIPWPWTREIASIEVAEPDAVTDKGQEVWNLLQQKKIKHLLVCGVHTNMCILHRTFAIKQMTRWGVDTVLVRDCTDTMYNPEKAPFVSHAKGTELVIDYIEQNWCPSISSSQIIGDAKPTKVLIVTAEQEYHSKETLPAFAKEVLEPLGFQVQHINSDDVKNIDGLSAMDDADVLMIFMRRRELPPEQLEKFKKWFDAGKPVVAVRTASHSFQNWLEFDRVVLGATYGNHYGKGVAHMKTEEKAANSPLLRGVTPGEFDTNGSLYKYTELGPKTTVLISGTFQDKHEPSAWTNDYKGGRVFYTMLGHPDDFKTPQYRTLLRNAVLWAADKPIPAK